MSEESRILSRHRDPGDHEPDAHEPVAHEPDAHGPAFSETEGADASGMDDVRSDRIIRRPRYSLSEALERLRHAQEEAGLSGGPVAVQRSRGVETLDSLLEDVRAELGPQDRRFLLRPSADGSRYLVDAVTAVRWQDGRIVLCEERGASERILIEAGDEPDIAEAITDLVAGDLLARESARAAPPDEAPVGDTGNAVQAGSAEAMPVRRGFGFFGALALFLLGMLVGAALLLAYGWVTIGPSTGAS
ncbi:MAG: hypothetical protein KDI98_09655 [Hyphomicrobiaceae bacterium]|nr:hypothetical protein [Hyphomicrobiaceae bacterium]